MPLFDIECPPCKLVLKDKLLSRDKSEDPHCPLCHGPMHRLPSTPASFQFKASPLSFTVDGKKCVIEPELREFNEKTWEPEGKWQG